MCDIVDTLYIIFFAKAVPLHATEALVGKGGIRSNP
jgi:hypothetical protein